MKKTLKIFMVIALTVLMCLTNMPANTVFAEDAPETETVPEQTNEETLAEEEAEVPAEETPAEELPAGEETVPEEEEPVFEVEELPEEEVNEVLPEAEDDAPEAEPETLLNADPFHETYTVGDLTVEVSYEAGTVPEGTAVVVGEAKPEALAALREKLGEDVNVAAADITFFYNDEEIEPKDFSENKVSVTLTYAGEENLTGVDFETYHVKEEVNEDGTVVFTPEAVEAVEEDITKTVPKYEEEPVYETREVTESRTTMVTKTRDVQKTRQVKQKVAYKWYDPSTWLGYKLVTENYTVKETYQEPVTEVVVTGYEEVQVDTKLVENGTEDIVVGQTVSFTADEFSTFTVTWGTNNGNMVTIHHGYMSGGSFVEFPAGSSTNTNYPTNLRRQDYGDNDYAVLIYDFKDYEYQATYYRSTAATGNPATGGTAIWPAIRRVNATGPTNDNWRYSNASRTNWNNDGSVAPNSHIYVIYTPKTIEEGYVPSSGGDDPGTTPTPSFTPDVGKNVTDQKSDGTYDITLGFVGNKESTESKTTARVIVVFDLSGSMEEDISGDMPTTTYWDNRWGWVTVDNPDFDGTSRLTLAKNAVDALADTLLDLKDSQGNKLVEMGLVTFATDGRIRTFGTGTNASNFTSDATVYKGVVDNLPISDDDDLGDGINDIGRGTNWEKGLDLANSMETSTAGKTYIVFVSDGDPTYRVSRGSYSDSELASERAIDNRVKIPIFGAGSGNTSITRCYETSKEVAKSIVDHNKTLYSVGLSSDATRMTNLATYAGGTYKPGNDADEFAASLADIAGSISSEIGLTDVTITDGVTSMSHIETQSLIGTAGNFTYNKSYPLTQTETGYVYTIGTQTYNITQAQVNAGTDGTHKIFSRRVGSTTVYYVEYPWEGENVPEAEVNANNSVVWNTSDANDELEHGVYYSVTFTVWPKQEAYDLIADLDNGIRKVTDSDLAASTKAQLRVLINGTTYEYANGTWTGGLTDAQLQALIDANGATFSMKTNTGLSADYKYGGVDMPTANYTNYVNGDMSLDATPIKFKKTWNNYLDARAADNVVLTITRKYVDEDNVEHTEIYTTVDMETATEVTTPDGGKQWVQAPATELFISLGVLSVTGEDITVREKGYDYTVEEPANFSYRWDLTADIYHPMVINGTTTVLIEVQDESTLPTAIKNLADNKTATVDGTTYYKFGGKTYVAKSGESMLLLEATNDRRSNLYIKKVVADTTAPEDDLFPITITIDNPNANHPGDSAYNTWYDTSWFFISTAEDDRNTIVMDGVEVSDNVTPEISELRTDDTHITNILTHEADDTYPYPYITYDYNGSPNTVKAVDLELHTGSETVEGETVSYNYYSYYTGFYWFDNGATVTVNVKDGWYINFNNMGRDTTYTIVEPTASMPAGYTLDEVTSSAENTQNLPVTKATISGNTATGTIDRPNSYYRVNYSNSYEGVYYVYHSANNDVYRYPMAVNGVKVESFNIFAMTAEGTLYGGYYTDYAGKSNGYDSADLTFDENGKSSDEDGTAYSYQYIKDSGKAAWNSANAYDTIGTAAVPVRNTTYFLKEVPDNYMLPYTHYTYYKQGLKIADLLAITAIDDLNYDNAGFIIETNDHEGTYVETLTIKAVNSTTTTTLTANKIYKTKGMLDGYLGYYDLKDYKSLDSVNIKQFWTTFDGITVKGKTMRTLTFGDGTISGLKKTDAPCD